MISSCQLLDFEGLEESEIESQQAYTTTFEEERPAENVMKQPPEKQSSEPLETSPTATITYKKRTSDIMTLDGAQSLQPTQTFWVKRTISQNRTTIEEEIHGKGIKYKTVFTREGNTLKFNVKDDFGLFGGSFVFENDTLNGAQVHLTMLDIMTTAFIRIMLQAKEVVLNFVLII